LSEQDRAILDVCTDIICGGYTAAEVSEQTHDQIWEAAQDGEEIPLYAIFASRRGAITDEVRAWANETAKGLAA